MDDSTTCVGRLEARLDYAYRLVRIDTRLSMQHARVIAGDKKIKSRFLRGGCCRHVEMNGQVPPDVDACSRTEMNEVLDCRDTRRSTLGHF